MPYNEVIEEKIERIFGRWKNMEKKKMFGGICYLINGNMGFGTYQDYLIVRTGMDVAEKKLKEKRTPCTSSASLERETNNLDI
jgi:TfoX/Sxy family transcriptional regulator of competence genes